MTIVTKPITDKKLEKSMEKPLVASEVEGAENVDHKVIDPTNGDVEAWLSSTARRRVSTATTICVFITALLVMSIGIIGGVYLYRQFSRHQMSRFRGWCGIPFERDSLHVMPLGGNPATYKGEEDAELLTPESLFKEEFELDLEEESFEQIRVPDFGFGHQGLFIHDFKANKTGIIDTSSRRCFVMPMDHDHVLPPRTVHDLVQKMWMGYYTVDTQVVRRTMRVVYPPVKDYESLGVYISKECSGIPTYRLERIYTPGMMKRSVDALIEDKPIEFVEFAGKKIVHLIIMDNGGETN